MASGVVTEIDFIEELRLRRWARENYLSPTERTTSLHPIILEEMNRKDHEVSNRGGSSTLVTSEQR